MPKLPVSPVKDTSVFTVSLIASGGDLTSTSVSDFDATVTGAQLTTLQESIGDLSNAGVYGQTVSVKRETSKANTTVLDESFSSAGTKAIFVFQDDNLNTRQITVPAPDASIFTIDGITVNTANALVIAFKNAVLAVINAGTVAGTYSLVRGYRAEHSRKIPRSHYSPLLIEPSGGVNPPALPAP